MVFLSFKVERHQFRGVKGSANEFAELRKRVQPTTLAQPPNQYQETNRLRELLCNNNKEQQDFANCRGFIKCSCFHLVFKNSMVHQQLRTYWANFCLQSTTKWQASGPRTFAENIIQEPFGQFRCNFAALHSRLIFEDSRQNLEQ